MFIIHVDGAFSLKGLEYDIAVRLNLPLVGIGGTSPCSRKPCACAELC